MYRTVFIMSLMILQQLSGEKHFEGDDHNSEYDHEAFVGREEAHVYDEMTQEESQKRLRLVLSTSFIPVKYLMPEYIIHCSVAVSLDLILVLFIFMKENVCHYK